MLLNVWEAQGDNIMCSVIEYGFTINGNLRSSSPCDAITSDTLGAQASISIEASDIGKTIVAAVGLRINDIGKGTFYSAQFTPTYSPGLYTFTIPFTGIPTQLGTYTLGYGGAGCSYIYNITNLSSYICYSCTSADCAQVNVTAPCTIPGCGFVVA
jgi:hypothetical protein